MTRTDALGALLAGAPRGIDRDPATAVVARIDAEGTFVAVPGSDPRQPIGPCMGGARLVAGDLYPEDSPIEVGTTVLLVWTDEGPWVAAVHP